MHSNYVEFASILLLYVVVLCVVLHGGVEEGRWWFVGLVSRMMVCVYGVRNSEGLRFFSKRGRRICG